MTDDNEHGIQAVWLDPHGVPWVAFARHYGETLGAIDGTKSAAMAAARRRGKQLVRDEYDGLDPETRMEFLLRRLRREHQRHAKRGDAAFAAGARDRFHDADRAERLLWKQLEQVIAAVRIVFGEGWWARFSYEERESAKEAS